MAVVVVAAVAAVVAVVVAVEADVVVVAPLAVAVAAAAVCICSYINKHTHSIYILTGHRLQSHVMCCEIMIVVLEGSCHVVALLALVV